MRRWQTGRWIQCFPLAAARSERLLDRLTLLLTDPEAEMVQPMARLLRAIGVPVLNLLETRLYEAPQRVTAAIKLLAAATRSAYCAAGRAMVVG